MRRSKVNIPGWIWLLLAIATLVWLCASAHGMDAGRGPMAPTQDGPLSVEVVTAASQVGFGDKFSYRVIVRGDYDQPTIVTVESFLDPRFQGRVSSVETQGGQPLGSTDGSNGAIRASLVVMRGSPASLGITVTLPSNAFGGDVVLDGRANDNTHFARQNVVLRLVERRYPIFLPNITK